MEVDPSLLIRGMMIGFSIAAPVGPIGVLCIRRTLAQGHAAGLVSGLGAATADAVYGTIAGFGLTFISVLLVGGQFWLRLLGGLFLLYLGVTTFVARPAERAAQAGGRGLLGAYASTFVLTLTNPATVLAFAAIFAGLGLASDAHGDYAAATWLVLGVFVGSALWWVLLSSGVSLLRSRVGARSLTWVNRLAGTIIATFGMLAIASLRM
ncbi:MAG: LysE family transporter [Chloroflexi bacterium]|nr:LysE family transporter [Chloroflexota bacterium]